MSGVATYLLWEVTKKITKKLHTLCELWGVSKVWFVNLKKMANWGANYNEKKTFFGQWDFLRQKVAKIVVK